MNRISKKASKSNGNNLLDWAEDRMPIVQSIAKRFVEQKPLKGIKIGVALHLSLIHI